MSETSTEPQIDPSNDAPPIEEFLTEEFNDMMHYVERYHATNGQAPDDKTMQERFNIAPAMLDEFKISPLVQKSLRLRGITYPSRRDFLTDRQQAAIGTMTNYVDRRSDEKKLRDIGITTREWATWLLDDNFVAYLSERAERMFAASQHEAHLGLIKGVRNGNVASVKLYNEMTGRHNPEAEQNFNVRMLMHGIIEILQAEIQDPVMLHRIAGRMMNLAARETQQLNSGGMGVSGRSAPPVVQQKEIEMLGEV